MGDWEGEDWVVAEDWVAADWEVVADWEAAVDWAGEDSVAAGLAGVADLEVAGLEVQVGSAAERAAAQGAVAVARAGGSAAVREGAGTAGTTCRR